MGDAAKTLARRLPVKYAGTAPQSAEEVTILSAVALITSLMRCVVWLIHHRVFITGFRGWQQAGRDRVAVTVAAHPSLHRLFQGNCSWRARRQKGALTVYTWFAERDGVRIEWEEVSCCG